MLSAQGAQTPGAAFTCQGGGNRPTMEVPDTSQGPSLQAGLLEDRGQHSLACYGSTFLPKADSVLVLMSPAETYFLLYLSYFQTLPNKHVLPLRVGRCVTHF